MGKWERQYLIIEPGDRDVRDVAGRLRAALSSIDQKGFDRPERDVRVKNGRVHWDSGERLTGPYGFMRNVHPELDVPCEWVVSVSQHEVESAGGAELYTWIDGGLVRVETTPWTNWIGDRAGLRYLKIRWGIDPAFEPSRNVFSSLPDSVPADRNYSRVSNGTPPLARFATEIVDESIETRTDAQRRLEDAPTETLESAVDVLLERIDRGERHERIDAIEQLYTAVAASIGPVDVTPLPVLDLVDETGREAMLAAAIVRELTTDNVVDAIKNGSAAERRQAARYLGLMEKPGSIERPIIEALSDTEPHVRTGVARALFKYSWYHLDNNLALDDDVDESVLFERLMCAVDDDDHRVRTSAVMAAALFNIHHDVGDVDTTLSAIAAELDSDHTVHRAIGWLLETLFWIDERPQSLPLLTAAVIPVFGERADHLVGTEYLFDPEILDAALAQLADEGWMPSDASTGTLVAVAKAADESFAAADQIREVLLDRLSEDPVRVTEALVSIADDIPTYLDDAVLTLTDLVDEEKVAATEALAIVAREHPGIVRDCWDTVEPLLAFEGEHARPAAEVVAVLAAEDPATVVAGPSATRDIVAEATSVLYGSLDDPDRKARQGTVELLVSLAEADQSVTPAGIEPFVDRNSGTTTGEELADATIEDRDVLATVAAHDTEAAARALSSLFSSLDPADDTGQLSDLLQVVSDFPGVTVELVEQLIEVLTVLGGQPHHSDTIAAAIAEAAEHDPTAVEPHVGTLLTCLAQNSMAVSRDIARALAAVEQASPDTLPPSLSDLAETDRGEDWPIDVLAASRPDLVDQMVEKTVGAEWPPMEEAATLLTTVAAYRPEAAETGVTRLVERADSVGYNSRLWSTLESVAESNPELAAIGLEQIVETTVESADARMGQGRKPARPLVVLAEQYPRRVWTLLKKHDPENDPTKLPERARRSRVEEKLEAIIDAAGPEKPIPERQDP